LIDDILVASTKILNLPSGKRRRYLRSDKERVLQQSASYCKTQCAGYATGQCRVPGCLWYNNNLEYTPPPPDDVRHLNAKDEEERELQTSSYCKSKCAGYATGYCPVSGCAWYNNNSEYTPLTDTSTTSEPAPDDVRHLNAKDEEERALATASYCKSKCAGYATGYCPVSGCGWYNNNSEYTPLTDTSTTSEPAPDGIRGRKLQNKNDGKMITTPCTAEQIKYINHELNRLVRTKAVSSPCQGLLKDARHVMCYRRNDEFNELNTGAIM
jgi:hypothetical protein